MGHIRQGNNIQSAFDAKFFVLRTPLLPFDEFLNWSNRAKSSAFHGPDADPQMFEEAWQADVLLLRRQLRSILERPEIVHALFVASPSLRSGIEHWRRDPSSKKGLQAERALVRYFERMSSRPTPFGIFAGYSVGEADRESSVVSLSLSGKEEYRTCTRLDFDYLFALTSTLHRDPALVRGLLYWPNSSLHRVSDAWHYVESRMVGGQRAYDLAKVAADEYLTAVLQQAQNGATFNDLVKIVLDCCSDSGISSSEAEEYIQELVNSQVLISNLSPLLTGRPPLDELIDQLSSLPSTISVSNTLQTVRSKLAALDEKKIGSDSAMYEDIAATLSSLPAKVELERLFQVDMIKPAPHAVLGKKVLDEFLRGIDLLCRLGSTFEPDELKLFRQHFSERYEAALVPILEALDEEVGVGFGRSTSDSSSLLRGLAVGGGGIAAPPGLSRWHALLLKKLVENGRADEMCLEPADFPVGTKNDYARLPDSFSLTATLAAASAAALQAGDFDLYLIGGGGPSGARLFGRFCQSDPELDRRVRALFHQEESNNPKAIYAEVAYLPEGRLGNVLCRPVLRDYEIPYLARSGAPRERQIALSDLLVGVSAGRIILYSKRLQRDVIPRLANAHGFWNLALPPVYRFLCGLQHQFGVAVPGFTWGPLENLNFLPRVRVGRLVLTLARWRISQKEIELPASLSGSDRFGAIQVLRQKRDLPRWVVLHEADNTLTADLDNPLSVDALVHVMKRRPDATLTEMYPPPELLCVSGPEGRFHHEINVPFVRRQELDQAAKQTAGKTVVPMFSPLVERAIRKIAPGREWLYLKLYGGEVALDEILTTAILPLTRKACASGWCCRWFFLRYADPHPHLRIRFNGQPEWLQEKLFPLITETFNPVLASGRLWKIQFDTYDREIERYGGPEGMSISEDIFFTDSEAALDILLGLERDDALETRWRVALLGTDRLLSDCGLDLHEKKAMLERLRNAWNLEFKVNARTKKQLAEKFRPERKNLGALLDSSSQYSYELSLAGPIFLSRSTRLVPAIRNLHALAEAGLLQVDIPDLIASYVHMHINRLVRSSARLHELVLYDFLFNLYDAMLARGTRGGTRLQTAENQREDKDNTAGNPEIWEPAIAVGGGEL